MSDKTMKRRLGLVGWGNSRPYNVWSKTLITNTVGEGHNPGTLAGAFFTLPVNNWNDPLGNGGNLVAGTGTLSTARRPMHHAEAISDGFSTVEVLSWRAKIFINWIAAFQNAGDFIVAYTFKQDSATEVGLTIATDVAAIEVREILTNPRWTKKRYQSDPGFMNRPPIIINVPDVFEYCRVMSRGAFLDAFGPEQMSHTIANVSFSVSPPTVQLHCTVVIASLSGLAMAIDSVHVSTQILQKVRIMRNAPGASDMNEGETTLHA